MRYSSARARQSDSEAAFRVYVADTMYLLARGNAPAVRYSELLHPRADEEIDAEAIIEDVTRRAGLEAR